ncbi:Scr1 family TA system antitoxin-like transcriptional regulator [Nonomuraea sediminis]|uniref:Scr1 family TA system antitoxin-like transcriptional regulator n=1 Tax=Nonomuraea sediminis TaxID=2835864 RepID=UPI001BDC012C|nr:Scr1 family TA system antitoxin-like transcriptional regulator [Nonomuraea sediminis]
MHAVGERLAALRRTAGLSVRAAASAAEVNLSTIYRIEHGLVAPREATVRILLARYGVPDATPLLRLLRGERAPDWYDAPDVPLHLVEELALEQQAQVLYTYGTHYVPPWLQTPAYTAAVHPGAQALTQRRQEELDGRHLWAVLDHAALADPPLTGADDRRELLEAIQAAAKQPHIAIQIARPSARTGLLHAGPPFTLLRFPERDRPDELVLHLPTGPVLVADPGQVEAHHLVFARLSLAAFRVKETFDVVNAIRET